MTKKRFWEIVRKINWSRYWKFEKNCDICRQRMLRVCTQDELKEFEDIASDMCSKLEERITDYYQTVSNGKFDIMCPKGFAPHGYIGDNTLNDGLWHIVGKGKSVYDKVMKNPDEFWKVFGNVYRMVATECFQFIFFEDKSLPEDKQIQLALAAIRKQFGVDENTIVAKMDKMDKNMVDITFDDKHYKLMVWPEEDGYANVQIYKPTFGLDGLICTIVLKI